MGQLPFPVLEREVSVVTQFPRCVRLSAAFLILASCLPVLAEPPVKSRAQPFKKPAATEFIRLKRDANRQPIALETAIVRYVPISGEGGLVVDLVGAVHIGDRTYYEKLNKQFETYDVLLY